MLSEKMESDRDNPFVLEQLYRENPAEFTRLFPKLLADYPDSLILKVWQARLNEPDKQNTIQRQSVRIWLMVTLLGILAAVSTRVTLYFADKEQIAPINVLFGVVAATLVYFILSHRPSRNMIMTILLIFGAIVLYLNILPLDQTDSLILAYLHTPIILWLLLGLAYTSQAYRSTSARLSFLKFNGEFMVLYAIMAIAGGILAMLTMQLFYFAGLEIAEFYFENIVALGVGFMAVIAVFLIDQNYKLAQQIAPTIARLFSPLILITLAVYLTAVAWLGKNPFLDRDFLIVFNAILLVVLLVTIFTLTERAQTPLRKVSDYVNLALISLALGVDVVALASILFRLSSYGVTPNRIAVLGANLLIGIHLVLILLPSLKFLRKQKSIDAVQTAVTRYLPVYGLWAIVVTIVFPLIFD